MTDTPSPKHVFMSYSREDEAVMRRVVGFLRKQGITVWVDKEEILPGSPSWEENIEEAIPVSYAVVVLLFPDAKKSEWVRRETTLADDHQIKIFPVLIRGNEKNAIFLRIIASQYIDLRKEKEEVGLNSLLTELSSHIEEEKRNLAEDASKEITKDEHILDAKSGEVRQSRLRVLLRNRSPIFWVGGIIGMLVLFSLGIWLETNPLSSPSSSIPSPEPTTSTVEPSIDSASTQLDIGERALGIHVTNWGGDINWDLVKDEGKEFVYIRATYGETISNPDFYKYWEGANLAELQRGASLSFDPDSDPIGQVDNFIQIFENNTYDGELPPVLSVESTGSQSNEDFLSKLQDMLTKLETKTGSKPIIQIESNFLEDALRDQPGEYPDWLAQYALWIVQYQYPAITGDVEARQPNLPDGCLSDWVFWGYSNIGVVPGVGSDVEMMLYGGSSADSQNSQPPPEIPRERAWGIDVSSWQGEIDWKKVKNSGVDFVYVRANSGILLDSAFQYNWDTLRQLEIPRGAYLDYRSDFDPIEQVEFFDSQVDLLPGDLPPVLVIEEYGMESFSTPIIQRNLGPALSELERVTGIQPIIYSREGFFKSTTLKGPSGDYPDWLTKLALWIAVYPADITNIEERQPDLLNGWKFTWLFWQYTDRGSVDGIKTPVDLNVYTGTPAELRQTFGLP